MQAPGLAAFERRTGDKSGIYAYELKRKAALEPAHEKKLKANRKAWEFLEAQPPWYRRNVNYWVTSAKREETRLKRIDKLIDYCARGQRL